MKMRRNLWGGSGFLEKVRERFRLSILKKYHVFAPMGRFQLELIYLQHPQDQLIMLL